MTPFSRTERAPLPSRFLSRRSSALEATRTVRPTLKERHPREVPRSDFERIAEYPGGYQSVRFTARKVVSK